MVYFDNDNFIEQIGEEGLNIHIFKRQLLGNQHEFLKEYRLCSHLLPLLQPFQVRPRIFIVILFLLDPNLRIYLHFPIFFMQVHLMQAMQVVLQELVAHQQIFSIKQPFPLPFFSHELVFPSSPAHLFTIMQVDQVLIRKHFIYEGQCD